MRIEGLLVFNVQYIQSVSAVLKPRLYSCVCTLTLSHSKYSPGKSCFIFLLFYFICRFRKQKPKNLVET